MATAHAQCTCGLGYVTFPYPDLNGSGLRHFPADTHLTTWLELPGVVYDVVKDWELHKGEGSQVLEPYRVVLTGTQPEYYTEESWNAMKDYRNNTGGRFCYLGGNGFYWKIAVDEENGVMEIRRGEGGIRAWASEPGEYYHELNGSYGGLWRRNGQWTSSARFDLALDSLRKEILWVPTIVSTN